MKILSLHYELLEYLRKRGLEKKFAKKFLFERNPFYPGLDTELLEPKEMRLWSFRIDPVRKFFQHNQNFKKSFLKLLQSNSL